MRNWAEGAVTGRPLPETDAARREELSAAIADAESASAAALAAQNQFRQEAVTVSAGILPLRVQVAEVERLIVLEDATALLPRLRQAIHDVHSLHREVTIARGAALSGADLSQFPELGAALAEFDSAREIAEARPRGEEPADYRRPAAVDQMAAEVARIASFRSNGN
jgi:hypothetical protein